MLPAFASAHGDHHIQYVLGLGAPDVRGPCASTPHPAFDVGGACRVQLDPGPANVSVVDAALGPIGFSFAVEDHAGNLCGEGDATASLVLDIDPPCRYVTILPAAGATTGDIHFRAHWT